MWDSLGQNPIKQRLIAQCVSFSASVASVCKPIIFYIVSHGHVVDSAESNNKNTEVTKQWCSSNPWSQQTEPLGLTRELALSGQSLGKWKKSSGTSDCLSVKIKQNDRKQLTDTHFTLCTPPENVKCHQLREWIFVCDQMRICAFTCTKLTWLLFAFCFNLISSGPCKWETVSLNGVGDWEKSGFLEKPEFLAHVYVTTGLLCVLPNCGNSVEERTNFQEVY